MDRCEALRSYQDYLRNAIEDVLAEIDDDIQAGIATDPARRRLRQLREQLAEVTRQLAACRSQPQANIAIAGIEHTQAIQFFAGGLGLGTGAAADNGIPLVSGKRTLVRVYPDVGAFTTKLAVPTELGATMTISGPRGSQQLAASPIAARPATAIDRNEITHSLNLEIPWQLAHGPLTCKLRVFDTAAPSDAVERVFQLGFVDVPALPIHTVLVHYRGPDFFDKPVDAQPSGFDALVCLDYVMRNYPISDFDFTGCDVIEWTQKVATHDGFYAVFGHIADLRALSGSDDIYTGLLPGAAGCASPCGLGGNGTALYFADDPVGAAHEIGHALGRAHTPCGVDGDPDYPKYPGLPAGSIGEVGVDLGDVSTRAPQTTYDFMSYCRPAWCSPYTYQGLADAIARRGPQPLRRGAPWHAERAEFHHLRFRLHRDRRVELISAFHLERRPPAVEREVAGGLRVEAVDATGAVLDTATAQPLATHHDREAAFVDYCVTIPRPTQLAGMRVVAEGVVLGRFELATEAPEVEIIECRRVESHHGDLMRVSWRGSPHAVFAVRYTADGERWRSLAVGSHVDFLVLDLGHVPGGENCRVQVLASAGLRTTIAETAAFVVPCKRRVAHVASPTAGTAFAVGDAIPLAGTAYSPDTGAAGDGEVWWSTPALGTIGMGRQLRLCGLPAGSHRITMHVTDGMGGVIEETVEIHVHARNDCACKRVEPIAKRCSGCGGA